MVFGWLRSERERRRKVRLDREHLEARARRLLKSYLDADETRKPQFYRAVEEASKQCQPVKSGLPPPELEDAQIAEATSGAAMKMVLGREERGTLKKDDRISDFVTDAYATVGIAYHRAAGVFPSSIRVVRHWPPEHRAIIRRRPVVPIEFLLHPILDFPQAKLNRGELHAAQ